MKCAKMQELISSHIDNRLSSEQDRQLKEHMQKCAKCLSLYNDLNKIVKNAGDLVRVEPSNDLWSTIRSDVFKDRGVKQYRFRWIIRNLIPKFFWEFRPAFTLAAAVIAVVIIYTGIHYQSSNTVIEKMDISRVDIKHHQAMELQYHYAIEELNRAIEDKKEATGFELTGELKRNLEIVDTSILKYRDVIKKEPDRADARNFLINAYKKKKDLLFKGYLISKL